ncbi:tachykinin-like peptides receptor 99D [Tubulanus polymorphus]|uniref:tachykinin-like peptides receptor 99D n=1 Tax=Tubulanus polymorphus TaxID=672921 RepID=UPI003DA2EB1F
MDRIPCNATLENATVPGYRKNGTDSPCVAINPFEISEGIQVVYFVAFVVMIIVAAGGNIIVIWIVVAHKRMRTVTNYFLVNLALADALISATTVIFNLIYMVRLHWPFGEFYCKFMYSMTVSTVSASVLTFMAIAIDRYVAIIHPLRPRLGSRTVLGIIGAIWILAILIGLPPMFVAVTDHIPNSDRIMCYLEWPDGVRQSWDFGYSMLQLFINYFLPLLVLAATYTRIGLELWGSQTIGENTPRQDESIKSKKKVVKMMIIVVLIFAICWLPQHIYFLLTTIHPSIENAPGINHIYLVIWWFAMSNSMYNPWIYCYMNARFRHGFKLAFSWLPCVKLKPSDTIGLGPSLALNSTVQYSMTETTRWERNGSVGHSGHHLLRRADTEEGRPFQDIPLESYRR